MIHADNNPNMPATNAVTLGSATRAIPTVIATDLLEKLIADSDALAVRRVVTMNHGTGRRK